MGLLKLMEDTEVPLRAAHDLTGQLQSMLEFQAKGKSAPNTINTRHILFIVSGAFTGLREIVRRRSDAERLAREAAMSRRALTMHMAVAHQRDTYWIRVASDLKKRVERDHHDLDVSLKALTHLLDELPATRKELAPHIDASLLLEEEERRKARAHAEQSAQRAAAELAKIRRLAEPR